MRSVVCCTGSETKKRGENGVAVNFIKIMNKGLHRLHPTAMLIAEDATAYPGVTKEVDSGGLGFNYALV